MYPAYLCNVMVKRSETWPVKKEHVIRVEKNDTRMVRWVYNVRPKDRISAEELRTRLKLNAMKECLQNNRL